MTTSEIKSDQYRAEVESLRQKIQKEQDVLVLRHNAARLKFILDVTMQDETGSHPSDD